MAAVCEQAYIRLSDKLGTLNFLHRAAIPFGEQYIKTVLHCPCSRCELHSQLLRHGRGTIDRVQNIEFIWKRARSLFALLVLCRLPGLITAFALHDEHDENILHLLGAREWAYTDLPTLVEASCSQFGILKNASNEVFIPLQHEINRAWTRFLRPQVGDHAYRVFEDRFKLPFFNEHELGDRERGVSGTVHRFQIYAGYDRIPRGTPPKNRNLVHLARKERGEIDPIERTNLEAVRELGHPHIARLLFTYRYRQKFNMVFPLATTNLRNYLRDQTFGLGQTDFSNIHRAPIWSQILGVVDALHTMHTKDVEYAMHLDLKPENILVDIQGAHVRFLITDFGLSQLMNPNHVGSGVRDGGGDEAYAPPERNGDRKHDIWSLGCILLEVLTFALTSSRGLQLLDAARGNQYLAFCQDRQLKPGVQDHLGRLLTTAQDPSNLSNRGREFVEQMVGLIQRMFSIKREDRPRAGE
ncbi:hypothetical protein LTR66_016494, partial [Elasticomyces elasticus]